MPEYAFDIQLNAVARTNADTEAEARQRLADLEQEFDLDYTTDRQPLPLRITHILPGVRQPESAQPDTPIIITGPSPRNPHPPNSQGSPPLQGGGLQQS